MEVINGEGKKSIKEQAKEELIQEKTGEFKERLKGKLRELQSAKTVVKNLEREVDFLEKKINQEIQDIES